MRCVITVIIAMAMRSMAVMMNISAAFSQNVVVYCVPLMNMGCAEPATNETDIHATVTAAVIAAMRRDGMLLAFAVLLSRHFTSLTMANATAHPDKETAAP